MTKTISEIKSFLDDLKIHYTEREDESRSCISVTSQRKDGSTYTLYMISNKDYDLSFYVFNLVESDKAHETQLLSAINKLNNTFKYAKFVLDNNYRVHHWSVRFSVLLHVPALSTTEQSQTIRQK